MANNYLLFSFSLNDLTQEEVEWWGNVDEMLEKENDFWFGAFQVDSGPNWVVIYSEESGDAEGVAFALQAFLSHFGKHDQALGFEFAYTCSKMRTGEFGGGACVVTSKDERWLNTHGWMSDMIKQMSKPSPEVAKNKGRK
jgi:hypothetical protein